MQHEQTCLCILHEIVTGFKSNRTKKDNLRIRDQDQHQFLPSCQVGSVSKAQHQSFWKRDEEFCCHSAAFTVISSLEVFGCESLKLVRLDIDLPLAM